MNTLITTIKILIGLLFLGGATMNLINLNSQAHPEEFTGVVLAILFSVGVGILLLRSAFRRKG